MRALQIALPALLLGACGLLYAEVEIPTVELTLPAEDFPGTGASGTFTQDIGYDLGKDISVITEKDVTVTLRLQTMAITSAATNLYPVQSLRVRVIPPATSSLPEVTVIDYQRPAGTATTLHTVEAAAIGDADLGPYLTAGSLTLRISGAGTLPAAGWVGDVAAAFYLKVRYPYGKQL